MSHLVGPLAKPPPGPGGNAFEAFDLGKADRLAGQITDDDQVLNRPSYRAGHLAANPNRPTLPPPPRLPGRLWPPSYIYRPPPPAPPEWNGGAGAATESGDDPADRF